MRRLSGLGVFLALVGFASGVAFGGSSEAICQNNPDIVYCMDWEGYSYPDETGGWCFNLPSSEGRNGCNWWSRDVVACQGEGFDGSNCAAVLYTPAGDGQDDSEWDDVRFPMSDSRVVFARVYLKPNASYTWSATQNKIFYVNDIPDGDWTAHITYDSWAPSITNRRYDSNGNEHHNPRGALNLSIVHPGSNKQSWFQNYGPYYDNPYVLPKGQWSCVEIGLTLDTNNQSNGRIELWINSEKVMDHQNATIRGSSSRGLDRLFLSGYLSGSSTPHGDNYMSYDNIVVSESRIGCLDSTNPNPGGMPTVRNVVRTDVK